MIFLYALHNHSAPASEGRKKKDRCSTIAIIGEEQICTYFPVLFPPPLSLFSRQRENGAATRRRNTKPISFLASSVPENLIITPP